LFREPQVQVGFLRAPSTHAQLCVCRLRPLPSQVGRRERNVDCLLPGRCVWRLSDLYPRQDKHRSAARQSIRPSPRPTTLRTMDGSAIRDSRSSSPACGTD